LGRSELAQEDNKLNIEREGGACSLYICISRDTWRNPINVGSIGDSNQGLRSKIHPKLHALGTIPRELLKRVETCFIKSEIGPPGIVNRY